MREPDRAGVDFAAPSADDRTLSARVMERVAQACRAGDGHIGFDTYMDLVLYTPEIGYYNAPRVRFGEHGDFVTAPELSPRFAGCIARALAPVVMQPGQDRILEAGAGSGALARGLLRSLAGLGVSVSEYLILERSASARAEQARTMGELASRVRWLDDFPAPGFRGAVIANELLDAIPAARFVVGADGMRELRVRARDDGLGWHSAPFARPADARTVRSLLEGLDPLPVGYVSEFAPARGAWLAGLAERVQGGVILLVDYGYPRAEYYHPQRTRGTLTCYHRHRAHDDPFRLPGVEDVSVHVDFTSIAQSGVDAGLVLRGFTTQAHFLLDTGLLEGLDDPDLPQRERMAASRAVARLTLPMEMGEVVKVMAFTRGPQPAIPGFGSRDLRHRL